MDDLLCEMENKMISGVGTEIQLSEEQKRALARLGYVAGGGSMESPGVRRDLPDIKDMAVCLDKQTDVSIAMRRGERGDEVLGACRELITMSPGTAKFHTWEGMILSDQKKFDEAMLGFDRARELAPDEFTTYNNMATVLIEQGKVKDAISNFEKALELNPINELVKYNLAVACNEYGHILGSAGQLEESVTYLRRAVEANPAMAPAHHNLGVAYLNLGKLNEAITQFEKALSLDPEYALSKRGLETARRLLDAESR